MASTDVALLAAGGGGSNDVIDIPLPAESYPATITDIQSNVIEAKRISMNGKNYFQAMIGKSQASIPFEKVMRIEIKKQAVDIDKNYYHATVFLKDSDDISVLFNNNSKLYGESNFGKFELYFRDLRTIEF